MTTGSSSYVFSQEWDHEQARLDGLSALFDQDTIRHLTAIGVTQGWHCLEVGAGGGSVARWLAGTVGESGRVVVTDLDTRFLADLSDPHIEVVRHDLTSDPLEEDAFDLVHARAVVEHLPDREAVIGRLVKTLRPGGVLVLEDAVTSEALSRAWEPAVSPPARAPALTRAYRATEAGIRAAGADPDFGLRLPAALAAAGLRDVRAELAARFVHGGSDEALFYSLSLRQFAGRLIDAGLITEEDMREVHAFTQDPGSRWLSLGLVTAWGRRG